MIIKKFDTQEEWLDFRRGKITGSRLKDIIVKRGTSPKKGYYELIAERLAKPADEENPMDRGTRLESEAIARFEKETKLKTNTDLVVWQREDESSIALSPDAYEDAPIPTWAVEVKCLNSASHIEAFLKQEIPKDYEEQVIQYFIVNKDLKKLYFVMYDPRLITKDFFYLEINREDLAGKIVDYLEYQKTILGEINKIVSDLTF